MVAPCSKRRLAAPRLDESNVLGVQRGQRTFVPVRTKAVTVVTDASCSRGVGMVISRVCDLVCLSVYLSIRAVRVKRLELSTPT